MKKDIKEITEQLEQGVKDVFTSDKYIEYLEFMTKFYNYSVNNIILILMQKPEASLVAGYKAWQTKFNRQVKKGEKGITILAPCPHKITVEKDGEEQEKTWMSFRAVKVFDISQTDGDKVPTMVEALKGEVENFAELIKKLEAISPVPVERKKFNDTAFGYYSQSEKKIIIKDGISEQQTIKTLIHEISHALMHDKENGTVTDADRNTREVQAESVAYTVCNVLGIDTSDYSFGYIAGWSNGKEIKELNESMEIVRRTAKDIIDKVAA